MLYQIIQLYLKLSQCVIHTALNLPPRQKQDSPKLFHRFPFNEASGKNACILGFHFIQYGQDFLLPFTQNIS